MEHLPICDSAIPQPREDHTGPTSYSKTTHRSNVHNGETRKELQIHPQAPLSMGFFRQDYSRGLPFPSPGDFPDLRIGPMSP